MIGCLYWKLRPKVCLNCWIALDAVDDSQEDLISGGPGDAYFFTNYTWHRGEPNLSGVNRAAYAIAYHLDRDDNLLSEDEFDALMDGAPQ